MYELDTHGRIDEKTELAVGRSHIEKGRLLQCFLCHAGDPLSQGDQGVGDPRHTWRRAEEGEFKPLRKA